MKKLLFISISALFYIQSYAADIIVTNDAKTIEAKVEEVSPEHIKYRKANNLTGPLFVMYTKDIKTITYDNGDIQTFETPNKGVVTEQHKKSKVKGWFGISVGWVFIDDIEDRYVKFYGSKAYTTLEERTQTLSNRLQVGFTFSPTFGQKGLGLYTGLYYEHTWAMKFISNSGVRYPKRDETRYRWLGVYGDDIFIPLHFQYKRHFNENLNMSISCGPSLEFGLDEINLLKPSDYVNLVLGCRVGFKFYGLQISVVTDWGVRPFTSSSNYADRKWFRHRPVALQLSYMF